MPTSSKRKATNYRTRVVFGRSLWSAISRDFSLDANQRATCTFSRRFSPIDCVIDSAARQKQKNLSVVAREFLSCLENDCPLAGDEHSSSEARPEASAVAVTRATNAILDTADVGGAIDDAQQRGSH